VLRGCVPVGNFSAGPIAFPILGRPVNPRGPGTRNDVSTPLRLRDPERPAPESLPVGFERCSVFSPLHGLRISRYRGGDAFRRAPGGGESRPTADGKLSRKTLSFPPPTPQPPPLSGERVARVRPVRPRTNAGHGREGRSLRRRARRSAGS